VELYCPLEGISSAGIEAGSRMTDSSVPAGTPDEALMSRIAAGEAQAFAALFERRQADVFRFALHMSQSPSIAEDVTQEVFLQVMRDAGRFDPGRGGVASWLLGIARNFVRRRFEDERGRFVPLDEREFEREPKVAPRQDGALERLARTERIELLRRAIVTLPLRYREAVVLCDLQELTYAEAASSLGCAVGTVRSRLHRGRALLAAKMMRLDELPGVDIPDDRDRPRGVRCFA
jgi:RNA polymerase sigma-70 factor (ECF subfamily)